MVDDISDARLRDALSAQGAWNEAADDFSNNEEILLAARRHLHEGAWQYAVWGSGSETTLRRNRHAFDRLAFRPRILVDVSNVDPSTSFLGHRLRIPVVLAPVGSLQVFDPAGAMASARASEDFGTLQVVSPITGPHLEDTARSSKAPKVFQLYAHGDLKWIKSVVTRAKDAGYLGLCLNATTPAYGIKEEATRWSNPNSQRPMDPTPLASLTWEMMDAIKDFGGLPFMLKGVQTAEDAAIAVEHGVDVIWVSNHGGRQLDHALGTMDTLPEIVQAVKGRAPIVLDGGVHRGSDIVKALALGANAVAIGRLQVWGLAAAGSAGLVRALEILEKEMVNTMRLLGVTRVDQLSPAYVTSVQSVTPAHELSTWVSQWRNQWPRMPREPAF